MEYALAAIGNAAAAIGILTPEGIVIVTEKKVSSKLLAPTKSSEKIYKVADHVFTAVAGLNSDANILLNSARLTAAQHAYTYAEDMPVEMLVQQISDYVHGYTQSGGLRPFGVAFLYAGWDRHHGYQLYQSDPSGVYRCAARPDPRPQIFFFLSLLATLTDPSHAHAHSPRTRGSCSGWKATAIGSNSQSATAALNSDYKADMTLAEAVALALKTLTKAMDTTAPSSEKLEVATMTRDGAGRVKQHVFSAAETDAALKAMAAAAPAAAPAPAP